MLLTAALIAFHYAAVADIRSELNRVLPCAALGIGVDFTLAMTGVYDFGGAVVSSVDGLPLVCFSNGAAKSHGVFV